MRVREEGAKSFCWNTKLEVMWVVYLLCLRPPDRVMWVVYLLSLGPVKPSDA